MAGSILSAEKKTARFFIASSPASRRICLSCFFEVPKRIFIKIIIHEIEKCGRLKCGRLVTTSARLTDYPISVMFERRFHSDRQPHGWDQPTSGGIHEPALARHALHRHHRSVHRDNLQPDQLERDALLPAV